MSEREFTPTPPDERDEVARLKALLAKAEFDADQKEAFGKFDVTTPNVGEETYQSFLDQRSKDGIVRDGESLRNTANGKFASFSDYEASNGTTGDYDNAQFERQSEQQVAYESMTLQELARKYGESEALNDKTMALDVLEALDAKMNDKAAANGWSAETKDSHYGQLMNIAGKASHVSGTESSTGTEVSEPSTPEKNTTVPTFEVNQEVKVLRTSGVLDAKGWTIEKTYIGESGNRMYVVANKNRHLVEDVYEDDLIKTQELDVDRDSEHPALDGESQEEYEARNGDKIDTLDGIVVSPLPKGDKIDTLDDVKLAEVPDADEKSDDSEFDAEKQSIWKRVSDRPSDLSIKAASVLGSAMFFAGNHLPAPKSRAGESVEAFEKRVKRRGVIKVIGAVAIIAAGTMVYRHFNVDPIPTGNSLGTKTPEAAAAIGVIGIPPHSPELSSVATIVTKGEGWYRAFEKLGITNDTEQANLLRKIGPQLQKAGWAYPRGSSWGISHTGRFTKRVVDLIQNNR